LRETVARRRRSGKNAPEHYPRGTRRRGASPTVAKKICSNVRHFTPAPAKRGHIDGQQTEPRGKTMLDGILSHTDRIPYSDGIPHSDAARPPSPMPWQLFALVIGLAALAALAAIMFPDVFATPFERF
jgi:hypothetical protein